jgi:hypothetical protein
MAGFWGRDPPPLAVAVLFEEAFNSMITSTNDAEAVVVPCDRCSFELSACQLVLD